MARQYKKILKKVKPKEKQEPPKKTGKTTSDYILTAFFALTAIVMVLGWSSFTNLNRALYVFLTATLGMTFVRRNYNLTPVQDKWVERVGYVTMAVATVLFCAHFYIQYIK